MTKLEDDKVQLFGRALEKVMTDLGHAGKAVGYYDRESDDTVIFKFKTVDDLDSVYPAIQDSYDKIAEALSSRELSMRKYSGLLELEFPRVVVFMIKPTIRFNPDLQRIDATDTDQNQEDEKTARRNEWLRFWSLIFIVFAIGLFVGGSIRNWQWYFWVSYAVMIAALLYGGIRVWWEVESFSTAHKFRLRKEQKYEQTDYKTT